MNKNKQNRRDFISTLMLGTVGSMATVGSMGPAWMLAHGQSITSRGNGGEIPFAKPPSLEIFKNEKDKLGGRRVFTDFVQARIDKLVETRKSELADLKTPEEWKSRQTQTRQIIPEIFGEFPQKTPLNARIVGNLDRDGYRVEKVIFESQPNYYVPANLYIPKGRKGPFPGIIFSCGHYDDAKTYHEYQMTASGFALKGYVVLIYDPMGQGERSEYFDATTLENLVSLGVSQHHFVRRPAFLVDWTFVGLCVWDAIRAIDYLESRIEVDKNSIAALGQSGGGHIAMYVTAVDERIKVCAVSEPGGSCENASLLGVGLFREEIQGLIAPRPFRWIARESRSWDIYEDLQLYYKGLKADENCDRVFVPGEHSMDQNNREPAYEWLNKWFDKSAEGKDEGPVKPEKIETLWCTESGNTIASLGGETGQTLNVKRADAISKTGKNPANLKDRINKRTGFSMPQNNRTLQTNRIETLSMPNVSIEKFTYESESGIVIPALLITPHTLKAGNPVYIFASDKGKPLEIDDSSMPFLLANNGSVVLAIDVRGIGETQPVLSLAPRDDEYRRIVWEDDIAALKSVSFGRTTLGMRTLDVIRGIDFLDSRDELKAAKKVIIGEGLGGLWALLASVNDPRVKGMVSVRTVPSYRLLITSQYYNVKGYFWVPGALRDYDIPDLARLASPKPQIWIDPVNALGEKLDESSASEIIGPSGNVRIVSTDNQSTTDIIRQFAAIFK